MARWNFFERRSSCVPRRKTNCSRLWCCSRHPSRTARYRRRQTCPGRPTRRQDRRVHQRRGHRTYHQDQSLEDRLEDHPEDRPGDHPGDRPEDHPEGQDHLEDLLEGRGHPEDHPSSSFHSRPADRMGLLGVLFERRISYLEGVCEKNPTD